MVESGGPVQENIRSLLSLRYEELNPNDPRFQNVKLYRGTTLDRLALTGSHNFTGRLETSKCLAGIYLQHGTRFGTRRPLSDEQIRMAKEFGIHEHSSIPVLITIHNSEKYLKFVELYNAIISEWDIDLGKVEPNDISVRELSIEELLEGFRDY